MKGKTFRVITLSVMLVGILFLTFTTADAKKPHYPGLRPMIFVHGYGATVSSIKTQFLRFASNGYPVNYLRGYEYNTSAGFNTPLPPIFIELDQLITSLLEETGAKQVDLLGHSLGTWVCQNYLNSSPERAAKVAHYANLDGGDDALGPPGGVPTLAVWGRPMPPMTTDQNIPGATNVHFPDCSHSQVVGIPETFSAIYNFFNGVLPFTTDIVPEPYGQVRLAGRVVIGTGAPTAPVMLEIWKVNGDTGFRVEKNPEAVYEIGPDGTWGPFKAKEGAHYEFCIRSEGLRTIHSYSQPSIRSDYWVRLTFYGATGMPHSANNSLFYVSRNKEWFGDPAFLNSDVLLVNGVNIINDINIPMSTTTNTMVVTDVPPLGVSHLDFYYSPQMFAVVVDYFVPAAAPPNKTISFVLFPRGGSGAPQVINVPNWASDNDSIAVNFNEYVQDIITWVDYVRSLNNWWH